MLLGKEERIAVSNIDIRNYAKFILQEGGVMEKREFLRCLKSDLYIKNKKVRLNPM